MTSNLNQSDRDSIAGKTPFELGYRMPAEWEPHQATWLSWPHNPDTWPGVDVLSNTERVLSKAVEALLEGETVRINVLDEAHRHHVDALIDTSGKSHSVVYHLVPTNDAWCRDHGAIFVTRPGSRAPLAATIWKYNAWGGKYPPFDLDEAAAQRMAAEMDVPGYVRDMVLEGGSVEVNGAGLLLTTGSCLLNPNRNPDLSRDRADRALLEMLGAQKTIWLEGDLAGDDTDGHIDNLVRFVGRETVVAAAESDPADVNYEPLLDNLNRLRTVTGLSGRPIRVIELPMPDPVVVNGTRLPASYVNFYVGNRVVLLPGFGGPKDSVARSILQEIFLDRDILLLDCRDVVQGLGAFHCLTQQVPVAGSSVTGAGQLPLLDGI